MRIKTIKIPSFPAPVGPEQADGDRILRQPPEAVQPAGGVCGGQPAICAGDERAEEQCRHDRRPRSAHCPLATRASPSPSAVQVALHPQNVLVFPPGISQELHQKTTCSLVNSRRGAVDLWMRWGLKSISGWISAATSASGLILAHMCSDSLILNMG